MDDISGGTLSSPLYSMYQTLKDLCNNNADFFRYDDSEYGQRICSGCVALSDQLDEVTPTVDKIRKVAPTFDLDVSTRANGYRSFTMVVDSAVLHCVGLCRQICVTRDSYLFRKGHYAREVEACSQLMASLRTCLQHLLTIMEKSEEGCLFPSDMSAEQLLLQADNINQYCFYGRCIGFQFCDSMQRILKFISIAMASFSEIYYSSGGIWSMAKASIYTSSRYVMDPELRARRIVNISQCASIDFCKAFWLLQESELMQQVPALVCPSVCVNRVLSLPCESLSLPRRWGGGSFQVPPPGAHIGPIPVTVRLISAQRRRGMAGEVESGSLLPPSSHLIIHCHGGGFVAQSSRSHEMYLRHWASVLEIPILSVDYSLAPEAPYPRALEEVTFSYCWALANSHLLGSTAEKVILVGDSAGATLLLGLALKCIDWGVRPPDGLLLCYAPVLIQFVPSPSRLLCLMDPLLPFGFMMRCLKAYTGEYSDLGLGSPDSAVGSCSPPQAEIVPRSSSSTESFEEVSEGDLLRLPPVSPTHSDAGSNTLTTITLASEKSKGEEEKTEDSVEKRRWSQQYVSQFLNKYVLDMETNKVPLLRSESSDAEEVLFEMNAAHNTSSLSSRIGKVASGWVSKLRFNRETTNTGNNKDIKISRKRPTQLNLNLDELDASGPRSPSEEFHFEVPNDPFLSPYLAEDDKLRQLPPIKFLTLHLDPCLDDCVMFSKRLRGLGNQVQLKVLDGLPHGFLSFAMVSKEAYEGSQVCLGLLSDLLGLEEPHATT